MAILRTKDLFVKYSKSFPHFHHLDEKELIVLQKYLTGIMLDIITCCESNGLTVMLAYGSALGAYRHSGFIPWDDDIDVFMPKNDYLTFLKVFPKEYGDKYYVTSPLVGGYTTCMFGKVIDKRSKFIAANGEDNEYAGTFVDVFPLENMPKNRLQRFCMKYLSLAIVFIFGSVLEYQNKSLLYKSFVKSSPELIRNHRFRAVIGFLFSFMSLDQWGRLFDKVVSLKKETGFIHAPTGDYDWTLRKKEVYYPTAQLVFDGHPVPVPGDITKYLEIEFGKNFMELPPVEKRWRHPIQKFEILKND